MTGFFVRCFYGGMVGTSILLSASIWAQRPPDFTGRWELVEALVTGATRDGTATEEPRRTTSTTISGAPFNCGRACTITHKGETLTIADAELADYPGKDKNRPTPPLTLRLNGREQKVLDTFNPPRELASIARWVGREVRIETAESGLRATRTTTQRLTLVDGHLIVISSVKVNGEALWETTFRYRKR